MIPSAKYTLGPWHVGPCGPNGCFTIGNKRGLMTAMISHSVNEQGEEQEAIANALLIAAAPELLETLIQFYTMYKTGSDMEKEIDNIEFVINKALTVQDFAIVKSY